MKSVEEHLTRYAACHRDRRNILTHLLGVPMIVFAVVLALATVSVPAGNVAITLAAAVSLAASVHYVMLDRVLGLAMAVVLFLMCAAASELIARTGVAATLGWAAILFVWGWGLQFLGHRFEGMKPAFFDDVRQLLVGPLFVCAEVFFVFGARRELRRHIEERVGPSVARRNGRRLPLAHE